MLSLIARGILELLWPPRTNCLLCQEPLGERLGNCPVCSTCWGTMAFPRSLSRCANCNRPLEGKGRLCVECAAGFFPFRHVFALGLHMGSLREAIHHFKFQGREDLGDPLGRRLAATVSNMADGLVPVPLHRSRLRERGYNQALLLARGLGSELGLPVFERGLVRGRSTGHQAKLDRAGRLGNLVGAFGVAPGRIPWEGKAVILVDDVLTTGATAAAAASVLLDSGAKSVDLAVLAVSTVPVRATGNSTAPEQAQDYFMANVIRRGTDSPEGCLPESEGYRHGRSPRKSSGWD